MRLLLGPGAPRTLERADLAALHAWPATGGVRINAVQTVDGAITAEDGRSGSINTEADHVVYAALRALADVVVVGAGTARTEEYRRIPPTASRTEPAALVVVSRSGDVPDHLLGEGGPDGPGILATTRASGRAESRSVWLLGEDEVDLAALVARLRDRGWIRILLEGGPGLFTDMLRAGLVDELALTTTPLLAGRRGSLVTEPLSPGGLDLIHLIESDATLLALWRRR